MTRVKTLQCKHIPDKPILEFLRDLPYYPSYGPDIQQTATWYLGFDNSVSNAMPDGTPEKLVLAKMRSLISRRLVDGCPCGCLGDFKLTSKGNDLL